MISKKASTVGVVGNFSGGICPSSNLKIAQNGYLSIIFNNLFYNKCPLYQTFIKISIITDIDTIL